jgi:hypothetical protein
MSAVQVLVSGCLFKAPEERTSQAGRRFVSATIKVGGESGNAEFWSLMVFSNSAQSELLQLGIGDALSAQGSAKIELYQKDGGEVRISRTVFASAILPLRQPPRERRAKQAATAPLLDRAAQKQPATAAPDPDLNDNLDDLPF